MCDTGERSQCTGLGGVEGKNLLKWGRRRYKLSDDPPGKRFPASINGVVFWRRI